MPMVLNNSGDSPYWEFKPSPEEQAAYDAQYFSGLNPNGWHEGPNTGPKNFMERLVAYGAPAALGAMAGYGALGASGLLGSELAGGGAGSAASDAASWLPSTVVDTGTQSAIAPLYGSGMSAVPGTTAAGVSPWEAINGFGAAGSGWGSGLTSLLPAASWNMPAAASGGGGGSGSVPPATTAPSSTGSGIKWPTTPEEWFKLATGTAGAAAGAGGGQQSSTGSLLGGLLGAGLGYLDARNQPDNITVTRTMDPKLAPYAYSAASSANDLLNQQLTGTNPLTQAGQQISGMSALPGWGSLVDTSKSQWDSNPWVQQQQKAITDLMTRNLKENVFSGVDDQANMASGYGGSKNAQALGLAASRMNTDLGPALANLASSAYESSQNRALAGAQGAANYGLNNQRQQADIWNLGANLQANGPWSSINNMSSILGRLPGNSSTSTPLFTNVGSNMLGGAQLGSGVGGSINWDELLKNIGGLLGGAQLGSGVGGSVNWDELLKNIGGLLGGVGGLFGGGK